jgi:hypothetical protein
MFRRRLRIIPGPAHGAPIRATIEAYGKGLITLPEVPGKTRKDRLRHVPQAPVDHPYTKASVAEFLGWTRNDRGDGLQPNYACEVAFAPLDAFGKGLITLPPVASSAHVRGILAGLRECRYSSTTVAQFLGWIPPRGIPRLSPSAARPGVDGAGHGRRV